MKVIVGVCLLVSAALALPSPAYTSTDSQNVKILHYEYENPGTGYYKYSYKQSDGMHQKQMGKLVNVGLENEHIVVKGSFTYIGNYGTTYVVTYTADENGYRPKTEVQKVVPVGQIGYDPTFIASCLG